MSATVNPKVTLGQEQVDRFSLGHESRNFRFGPEAEIVVSQWLRSAIKRIAEPDQHLISATTSSLFGQKRTFAQVRKTQVF